MIQNKRFLTRF